MLIVERRKVLLLCPKRQGFLKSSSSANLSDSRVRPHHLHRPLHADAPITMSFAVSRALVRQSRFAVRRAGLRNASTTSEAAGAAKEKAGDAAAKVQSKASEGLTKVKSSAETAASKVSETASNAASTVNSTASQAQGRVGRLVGAVQGKLAFFPRCHWAVIYGGGAREGGVELMRLNGAVGELGGASQASGVH